MALIGGWTVAASVQPHGYSSIEKTISALAQVGATDRWLMTSALVVLGVCHIATALGLRFARLPGRVLLAVGGVFTLGVAAFPLDEDGRSLTHAVVALIAFVALAVWPSAGWADSGPIALQRPWAAASTLFMSLLVLWFFSSIGSAHEGLAERCAAGAQALWPLAVVTTALMSTRRASLASDA